MGKKKYIKTSRKISTIIPEYQKVVQPSQENTAAQPKTVKPVRAMPAKPVRINPPASAQTTQPSGQSFYGSVMPRANAAQFSSPYEYYTYLKGVGLQKNETAGMPFNTRADASAFTASRNEEAYNAAIDERGVKGVDKYHYMKVWEDIKAKADADTAKKAEDARLTEASRYARPKSESHYISPESLKFTLDFAERVGNTEVSDKLGGILNENPRAVTFDASEGATYYDYKEKIAELDAKGKDMSLTYNERNAATEQAIALRKEAAYMFPEGASDMVGWAEENDRYGAQPEDYDRWLYENYQQRLDNYYGSFGQGREERERTRRVLDDFSQAPQVYYNVEQRDARKVDEDAFQAQDYYWRTYKGLGLDTITQNADYGDIASDESLDGAIVVENAVGRGGVMGDTLHGDVAVTQYSLDMDGGRGRYMTDEEKGIARYLYSTQGQNAVDEYMDLIGVDVDRRRNEEITQEAYASGESDSWAKNVLLGGWNTLNSLIDAPAAFADISLQQLNNSYGDSYTPINPYDTTMRGLNAGNAYQAGAAESMGKVGGYFYNLGMSMVASGGSMLMGTPGAAIMGTAAFTSEYSNRINNGTNPDEAYAYAFASGFFEAITEYASIDNLLKMSPSQAVEIFKQMGVEGAEELASDFLGYVFDRWYGIGYTESGQSDYERRIAEYEIEGGMSREEAEQRAFVELMKGWGLDAVGGIITGGAMAGAYQGASAYGDYRTGSKAYKNGYNADSLGAAFEASAEAGTPPIETILGYMYDTDRGVIPGVPAPVPSVETAAPESVAPKGKDLTGIARPAETIRTDEVAPESVAPTGKDLTGIAKPTEEIRADETTSERTAPKGKDLTGIAKPTEEIRADETAPERAKPTGKDMTGIEKPTEEIRADETAPESTAPTGKDLTGIAKPAEDIRKDDIKPVTPPAAAKDSAGGVSAPKKPTIRDKYRLGKDIRERYTKALARLQEAEQRYRAGTDEATRVQGAIEYARAEREIMELQRMTADTRASKAAAAKAETSAKDMHAITGVYKGGEHVRAEVGVRSVASVGENGTVRVTEEDGTVREVPLSEIEVDDESNDALYCATHMPTVTMANVYLNNLVKTQDVADVAQAMDYVYQMAKGGVPNIDYVRSTPLTRGLTDVQISQAFEIGKLASEYTAYKDTDAATESTKTELGKDWHGGTFDIGEINYEALSGRVREQVGMLKYIAGVTGINVKMFESIADAEGKYRYTDASGATAWYENGHYDRKTNTVWVDVNAGRAGSTDSIADTAILRTVSHELTHAIQKNSPAQYAAYKDAVLTVLAETAHKDLNMLVRSKMASDPTLTYETALDEVVADASELMLRDSDAAQRLNDAHPEVARTLWQHVKDALGRIKRVLRRAFSSGARSEESKALLEHIEEYETLAKKWADALVDASGVNEHVRKAIAEKFGEETVETLDAAIEARMVTDTKEVETSEETLHTESAEDTETEEDEPVGLIHEPARPPEVHIDARTWESVGSRSVKPFMNEYTASRWWMHEAAGVVYSDVVNTIPGERFMTPDGEWMGQSRQTSAALAELKDNYGYSWAELEQTFKLINEMFDDRVNGLQFDKDLPNTAVIKRAELLLDEALSNGYTDMEGNYYPADKLYLEYKRALPCTDIARDPIPADARDDSFELAPLNEEIDEDDEPLLDRLPDPIPMRRKPTTADMRGEAFNPVAPPSETKIRMRRENAHVGMTEDLDKFRRKTADSSKTESDVEPLPEGYVAMGEGAKPFSRASFIGDTNYSDVQYSPRDAAYLDAVNRGDMETAQKMVDEAAREALAAGHEFNLVSDDGITSYKLHRGAKPKKTLIVYKTFNVDKNGRPTATYAGIDQPMPYGVWLDAVAQEYVVGADGNKYIPGTTGTSPKIAGLKSPSYYGFDKKYTSWLSYRPAFHASSVPAPLQMRVSNPVTGKKDSLPHNKLIFRVEVSADINYQNDAKIAALAETERRRAYWRDNAEYRDAKRALDLSQAAKRAEETGKKFNKDEWLSAYDAKGDKVVGGARVQLDRIPEMGYYTYKNQGDDWVLSGSFRVLGVVGESEMRSVNDAHGYPNSGKSKLEWIDGYHPEEFGLVPLKEGETPVEGDPRYKRLKLTDPVTYDDSGNIIPLSERFNDAKEDIRYSPRADSDISTRELLSGALETTVRTGEDAMYMREYKDGLAEIEKLNAKRDTFAATVRELQSKKERTEDENINLANAKAVVGDITKRIDKFDRKLLKLEAMKPMQDIIAREESDFAKAISAARSGDIEQAREIAGGKAEWLRRLERMQDRFEDVRERDAKAIAIRRIQRTVARLDDMLRHPTDARHVPDELKNSILNMLSAFTSDTSVFDKAKLGAVLREYTVLSEQWSDASGMYDEHIAESLRTLVDTIGGRRLAKLSSAELKAVSEIVGHFAKLVRDGNNVFIDGKRAAIAEISDRIENELDAKGPRMENKLNTSYIADMLRAGNITPPYFFKHIAPSMGELGNAILRGITEYGVEQHKAAEKVQEIIAKYHAKDWARGKGAKSTLSFVTEGGAAIELTAEEALGIWATHKREASDKITQTHHLDKGGITRVEEKSLLKKTPADTSAKQLSSADIAKIDAYLTTEQKAYADEMVKYLTSFAAAGNKVSMTLHGYEKFGSVGYYYPFKTDADFRATKLGDTETAMVKNMGFTKSVMRGAAAPVVITGFTETCADHVNNMLLYTAFAIPQDSFMRVYDHKLGAVDGTNRSIKTRLAATYGRAFTNYIRTFMNDMYGGVTSDYREKGAVKLLSEFKKGAVGLSASVAVQQVSSIARAFALVSPKYFFSGKLTLKSFTEAMDYAGTATIKDMGKFDTNVGLSAVEYITGLPKETKTEVVKDKLDTFSGFLPNTMDKLAWGWMWDSIKRETAAKTGLALNSEALKVAAGKRFDEVMNFTQVYDCTLVKSSLMRSNSGILKMATAFKAEPTINYNMLMDAAFEFRSKKPGSATRIITAVSTAAILNALLAALVYAMRDDDDDKATYAERYTKNVLMEIDPVSYFMDMIPFVSDVYSIFQGYDVKRTDMQIFADITKYAEILLDPEKTAYEKWKSAASAAGIILGLPVKNAWREIEGILNTVTASENARREGWFKTAVERGIAGWVWTDKLGLADASKGAATKDYVDAVLAGDTEAAAKARETLTLYHGREDKDIASDAKADIKARYTGGEITSAQAKAALTEACGLSARNADELIAQWDYTRESGLKYTELHDDYLNGVTDRRSAYSTLTKYGGEDTEDAEAKLLTWDYKRDTGRKWSELRDDYIGGEVSAEEAETALTKYGGEDENGAYWLLDKWDYARSFGADASYTKWHSLIETVSGGGDAVQAVQEVYAHSDYDDAKSCRTAATGALTEYYKPLYLAASESERARIEEEAIEAYADAWSALGFTGYSREKQRKTIRKWLEQ